MLFRRLAPAAGLAIALAVSASAGTAAPTATTVHIANFAFGPTTLTVAPGSTITWVNDDDDAHSIVADTGGFHSAALDTGDRYSFTFRTVGAYAYHCGLHPHMVARIVVRP